MKELIQGQTMKCDAHDAGSGQKVTWGRGLHIHKRMTGKEYGYANIRIPLDNDGDIEISARGSNEVKIRLKNEIKKAFKNKEKRNEFAQGLIKEIERFSNDENTEENLRKAAKRIAKHFELNNEIEREMTDKIGDHYIKFTSIHNGFDGRLYFISQSRDNIKAGEFTQYSRI